MSYSISTIIDKHIAVKVTKTTESACRIKKNTQIAESSLGTMQQTKYNKPVDTAILKMIPQGDTDLTRNLSKRFMENKLEQQSNTFWFPTPEKPGKTGNRIPI